LPTNHVVLCAGLLSAILLVLSSAHRIASGSLAILGYLAGSIMFSDLLSYLWLAEGQTPLPFWLSLYVSLPTIQLALLGYFATQRSFGRAMIAAAVACIVVCYNMALNSRLAWPQYLFLPPA
jgi:hypothetical protein